MNSIANILKSELVKEENYIIDLKNDILEIENQNRIDNLTNILNGKLKLIQDIKDAIKYHESK